MSEDTTKKSNFSVSETSSISSYIFLLLIKCRLLLHHQQTNSKIVKTVAIYTDNITVFFFIERLITFLDGHLDCTV